MLYTNLFIFLFLKFFKQKNNNKIKSNLYFLKNNFFFKTNNNNNLFKFLFPNRFFKNIISLLLLLIGTNVNFLFLDENQNYNYLPVGVAYLDKKNIYKTIKFFNIKVLLFLDIKPNKIKKFFDFKLINITTTNNIMHKNMDFFYKFKNLKIFHYILYILVLGTYINN